MRSAGWTAVPLVLVVVVLLGSVLIPAGLTWRVLRLLQDITEVIEPARRIEAQLETGLSEESAALRGYALSGDSALLERYRATAVDDERRITTLDSLGRRLDEEAVGRVVAVRRRADEWRQRNRALAEGRVPHADVVAAVRAQQADYDSTLRTVARLESYLARETAIRGNRVRASERLSLVVNASLVLVALAAVFAVAALIHRERRLTLILQRRIEEEAGLREAAEALATAFTMDEVTQEIPRAALAAMQARGAFVEQITALAEAAESPQAVVVQATAGDGAPALGTNAPYVGSYTDMVLQSGTAVLVPDLARPERPCTITTVSTTIGTSAETECSAIVVPLGNPDAPVGALFVVSAAGAPFRPDDLPRADTFGHLAALAYEKVRLLDEARAGRQELERVMKSRSRLMRGFSHDVKNPLGAADGYAELLTADIYGPLSAEQRKSIERIRWSIRSALALIDDLHELARAETGHLALSPQLVDLGDLIRTAGEEYRAAATARGLSISVDAALEPPLVETDPARVRQIVGNLVSNAIKYAASGSVTLCTRRLASGPVADARPWAAIDVSDTGPGIPPDKQVSIFEEFVRLGTGDRSGAGLGLSISLRLARMLGGQITLHSEVGRGSTFTLWLPLESRAGSAVPGQPASVRPSEIRAKSREG